MYKMRLIGQKEPSGYNGLITLASHQGKKPNSIHNERIVSGFEILSVSPNIFIFHSNKIVVSCLYGVLQLTSCLILSIAQGGIWGRYYLALFSCGKTGTERKEAIWLKSRS